MRFESLRYGAATASLTNATSPAAILTFIVGASLGRSTGAQARPRIAQRGLDHRKEPRQRGAPSEHVKRAGWLTEAAAPPKGDARSSTPVMDASSADVPRILDGHSAMKIDPTSTRRRARVEYLAIVTARDSIWASRWFAKRCEKVSNEVP